MAEAPATDEREDVIRRTAYDYYEARGRMHGHELDDWVRAEAEFERVSAARDASQGH
jgi:hypothetical protein